MTLRAVFWCLPGLLACREEVAAPNRPAPPVTDDTGVPTETLPPTGTAAIEVVVTLDGEPALGATVVQGGGETRWTTDAQGRASALVDYDIEGQTWMVASHPDARTVGVEVVDPLPAVVTIALERYDRSDNPVYTFRDPGEPDRRETTQQCAHCHVTINAAWYASPHRTSASNPAVQDLYAGVASAIGDEAACGAAGGVWSLGVEPGTGAAVSRCFLGAGVQVDLDGSGACADCHAPGIDGVLGGRGLHEATGLAYDFGVHCEVCHTVDAVDLAAPPGVAGRLQITRPSEKARSGLDVWETLLFGPYDDVPTFIMGAVRREHFDDATLCAGCHEQAQAVLVPGEVADPARWPDGLLPIHSTYSEWLAGPMNPGVPCPACHMPPDPDVGNAADLGNIFENEPGYVAGWYRPAGQVREHAWYGPRQRASGMLELAAALTVTSSVAAGELVVDVTVKNVGPGHAIPTGEPLRSLVLLVEATCGGAPLVAVGGDTVPDFGGTYLEKRAGDDWTTWPGAVVGQVVRVVRRSGAWRDYSGYGPFGDGTFDAAAKGMPVDEVAGASTIVAMLGDTPTFEPPLPAGDVAWLGDGGALPTDGEPATARAGAPGFAFARVLADAQGNRMVPHFLAVDVVSDNRLGPQALFATHHQFAATCADPEVHVVLVHRAYPLALAAERHWSLTESLMAEVGP